MMMLHEDSSSGRYQLPQHSNVKNALVDKTHINDVFDTSTVIADGVPQSPGKSAIPRRDSSGSDQEIKRLKEAMFNDMHDRSVTEEPSGATPAGHLEYGDYTP
jgi:hypothetical protein